MGPTAPFMPVLGPVVHQHQDASIGKRIDQQVEQALGLAVNPVQVFEDNHQWLVEALPQHDAFDCLQYSPPPDLWAHVRQRIAGFRNPVQSIKIRQDIFETAVEPQHFAEDAFARLRSSSSWLISKYSDSSSSTGK